MAADAQAVPRLFRVFISYASEDKAIAEAMAICLKVALGEFFAEINLDNWFLKPGSDFKKQIESKLQKTDVFLIIYTGAEKASHSYTGWEVGYFDHVAETSPGRLKIAIYLDTPPAISAEEQGVSLKLGPDKLQMSPEKFEQQLVIDRDDALCELLDQWQKEVAKIVEGTGFVNPPRKDEQDPAACVRKLKLAIFTYLKGTVQAVVKPQKQITIRLKGEALEGSIDNLPMDAEIQPMGAGTSMSIFGLSEETITWQKFLELTKESHLCDSWRESITSVVMSTFPDRVNVDNSQIILSSDESKTYRVILTTATKYYNDRREFNLYFVETLNRTDFGDESTTYLLKGLQLVCRFRFVFLETDSEFSAENILAARSERLPEQASRLLKELNLMRKDARDAGLDKPAVWRKFITWDHINQMSNEFYPRETALREIIQKIVAAKDQPEVLTTLRKELSTMLGEMENAIRPENSLLIQEMAAKLELIAKGNQP